jgi:TolB-like protein
MRLILLVALAISSGVARAQSVAMLNMALYNDRANVKEATDSVKAVIATEKLRDTLARFPGVQLVDSARVAAAEASPPALTAAAGKPCNVIVACARAVGKTLGVQWVVMGTVSKTSNLIWLFSGELINVATGELILDDDCELKGDPNTMVPAGVGLFANRVSKRVTAPVGA